MAQSQSFVKPTIQVNAPQAVEERPSFRGEVDSKRVIVFFIFACLLAAGSGALAYNLGLSLIITIIISMLVLAVAFVPLYRWDAQISTGYLHKREEQTTERLRIDAAMLDAVAINAEQSQQIAMVFDELRRLDERINAIDAIRVIDNTGTKVINKNDPVDSLIQQWLARAIFDSAGRLAGIHPNGQIKSAMPFKETSQEDNAKTAYRRLIAAGLIGREGNNYIWIGPSTLSQTIRKLQDSKTNL